MEDKDRKTVTVVERGVLKAGRFAGAVHIPREGVDRIGHETAP